MGKRASLGGVGANISSQFVTLHRSRYWGQVEAISTTAGHTRSKNGRQIQQERLLGSRTVRGAQNLLVSALPFSIASAGVITLMKPLFCPKLAVTSCQSVLVQDTGILWGELLLQENAVGRPLAKVCVGNPSRVEIGSLASRQGCTCKLYCTVRLKWRRSFRQASGGFVRGLDLSREQRQCCEQPWCFSFSM
jgi:hypothetical protein